MTEPINTVGVVGVGVMGFDIAFLYAMKGFQTLAYDSAASAMNAMDRRRAETIERLARRNRISDAEARNVRALLKPAADIAALARADLVTEAVSEKRDTKLSVYRALRDAGFSGILTTNTSSVTRATLLGGGTCDPKKFALTHFFNPVLYTQMVEVEKGDMEPGVGESLISFLKNIGRRPVETRDISGFVSNGILMVYAVMALRLLERGARIEQIDQAAKELNLLPPLFSFDSWKPSIVEDVTRVMFELRGDAFLRSSRLLWRLAEHNPPFYIERKANAKIYHLAEAGGRSLDDATVKQALWTSMLIAAARVAELGESPAAVDFIATEGLKMPRPPLEEIDALGAAQALEELASVNQALGDRPLTPPQLLMEMAKENQKFYQNDKPSSWLLDFQKRSAHHARH
jgi:3-hydroxyacyl-CoA dehydrogenase